MTAESLKPFISLPENFSSEKRSSHRLVTIGLCSSFVILSVAMLGFTIWNSIRVCELQTEVDSLRNIIGSMQKRLGLDYLDDLNEFDDGYLVDDPKPYAHQDDEDDDDNDEDDEDEDDDSIYDEELKGIGTPPMSDFGIFDGSGQYGDDDEDSDDSFYDSYIDEMEKPDAKKERKSRSISSLPNGIPIYEDSYALKRNRTGGPDDERIEHHLLANKGLAPTLRYDWSEKSTMIPTTSESTPTTERGRGRYQSAPSNMVKSVNGGRKRFLRRYRNQRLMRPLLKSGKIRGNPQAMTAFPVPSFAAVHFHLNSTISGRHLLHANHNKLPHDGDVYIGAPHPWARQLGMDRAFSLNHGVLTVKDSGLYFVYAQIYYDNRFDRNGFVIYHNVHPFLQCALFVPTNANKSHTCYTSGVIYLESNDELHLRDIHQDRIVMLTNAKSFFGIIKLAEI